jgi:diguanylate cyclase (GGDEF)-like protein
VLNLPQQSDRDGLLPILDRVFDAIALVTHSPWRVHFANRAFASWLGQSPDELGGLPLESVLGTAWPCDELLQLLDAARIEPARESNLTIPIDPGPEGIDGLEAQAFQLMGYESPLFVLVLRPLISQTTYRHTARHDPLTGLPDRAFLMSRLTTLLEGERLADRDFAVLFIDLDNFKRINDRHGHLTGDRVLHAVAQRLRGCVRECDHVTRYGGDEFVILLERVSGMPEVEPVLARIRSALTEPFVVPEEQLTITLSIGLALSGPHLRSPDDVLREADRAMYAAKRGASVGAPIAPATF